VNARRRYRKEGKRQQTERDHRNKHNYDAQRFPLREPRSCVLDASKKCVSQFWEKHREQANQNGESAGNREACQNAYGCDVIESKHQNENIPEALDRSA
jgi:hypothetical protein